MKQLKETPEFKISAEPRFRYWTTPPEFLELRVSEIEAVVPKGNWIGGAAADQIFRLPASVVLSKNVPRISLRDLADALPECVLPSDGVVKLPAARLAAGYRLVENREEIPVEVPEPAEEPEPVVEPTAEPVADSAPAADDIEPPAAAAVEAPPAPPEPETPPVPAGPEPSAHALPSKKISPQAPGAEGKMPSRREGSFIGLPIFRRKPPVEPPVAAPQGDEPQIPPRFTGIRLPKVKGSPIPIPPPPPASTAEDSDAGGIPDPLAMDDPAAEPAAGPVPDEAAFLDAEPTAPPEPPAEEAFATIESAPEEAPAGVELPPDAAGQTDAPDFAVEDFPAEEPLFVSVPPFQAESNPQHDGEITEQEPLQALFLTEENLTVGRVIELCGSLPGINSCVLAHESLVVASHNVPEGIDLVSMSAHAAEMLRSMRESSARMGVGTVPAVTLHTEKGVISFFHRDDLTMLVFHKDRGFIPGVREKIAAVLGELTKSRLTLPAGSD